MFFSVTRNTERLIASDIILFVFLTNLKIMYINMIFND